MDLAPTQFPWRDDNRFRLLRDSAAFLPAMTEAIAAARVAVAMEMYLAESGQVLSGLVDALAAAASRGVEVSVLWDGLGSSIPARCAQALEAAGVRVAYFNPLRASRLRLNLIRNHRKLLVVDGRLAYTGGLGLTDDFLPGAEAWRENVIEIHGPCAADWQRLFADNWRRWSLAPLRRLPAPAPVPGGACGRVISSHFLGAWPLKRATLRQIRAARHRVWLASAYFLPAWKLRQLLQRCARRGLDVRLLLPGEKTDHPSVRMASRRFYGRFLRHGVRIFEYQPRFMHAKTLLCDDTASVGSCNLDRWSLRWNLEANQQVRDPALAAETAASFERDWRDSLEITWPNWRSRPWPHRLMERASGRIEDWLARQSYRTQVRLTARTAPDAAGADKSAGLRTG